MVKPKSSVRVTSRFRIGQYFFYRLLYVGFKPLPDFVDRLYLAYRLRFFRKKFGGRYVEGGGDPVNVIRGRKTLEGFNIADHGR